jgi:hypothetical protein
MLRSRHRNVRSGKILVFVALLLPPLCGMIGLVIDVGVMLTVRRHAQNAADAAARAAALERVAGGSDADARVAAEAYVQSYNALSGATVTLNSPPLSGSYSGNPEYVEIVVTVPTEAWFIPAVGGPRSHEIRARAVAGPEALAAKEALCILDPNAVPGLTIDRTTLRVNGRIWVNSQGAGQDESGGWVDLGLPSYAVERTNGGAFEASRLSTVGGVDSAAAYVDSSGVSALKARQLPRTDPLMNLATPTTSTGVSPTYPGINGQVFDSPQDIAVTLAPGETVTLSPGIYSSINVTGTGSVSFQPGIFVLQGGNANGHALNLSVSGTVSGSGVMFYNTGSNYDPATGEPDRGDGNVLGTDPDAAYGDIVLNSGFLSLSPLSSTSSPFAGMLIYQRRWNTMPLTLYHNNGDDSVKGTIYARWAKLTMVKSGTFTTQCVVGSFVATSPTAGGYVTLNPSPTKGKAKLVYLVE